MVFRFFSGACAGPGGRGFVLLLLCFSATTGLEAWNRAAARQAYKEARRYHDQLLEIQEDRRILSHYNRAIFLYTGVVDKDPTYGGCDDALYFIATLFDEMATRFQNETHLRRAIYYYEFVSREYPRTRYRGSARERARQLNQWMRNPDRGDDDAHLATVSEIRYRSSEEYTRVVIQLDREVEFQKHILHHPDRIYFDLLGTRLDTEPIGKAYSVNDVFLKQIRVAKNRKNTVRVVLDFKKIHKHTVFALYDPFRIVIDTRGDRSDAESTRPEAERTVKTAEAVIPFQKEVSNPGTAREIPAVSLPNLGGERSLTRVLGLKIGRVALDPGHGGADTGTIGPTGLQEKDLVLDIALQLKELLEERLGTDVVLTRSTDQFVPLEERTAIANQYGADLFVSIHANSSRHRKVSGTETFFLNLTSSASEREVASRENATSQKNIRELEDLLREIALGEYNEESKELARVVQESLHRELKKHRPNSRNRGVKKAPFIVLIGSNMPSILTEVAFLSNASDEKYLKRAKAGHQLAEALYRGIESYFRSLGTVPLYERASKNTSR